MSTRLEIPCSAPVLCGRGGLAAREGSMTSRNDERERERRERKQTEEADKRRREERDRRSDDLKESWRRNRPSEEERKGRSDKGGHR